jgi:DNA polymerase family A
MVAKHLRTGQTWQIWRGEFGSRLPFPIDVLIAYYASAELGCFQALGLPFPTYVLDLFTEFRALTNGRNTPNGPSLLGALTYFGLDGIDASEKQDLRTLILSGGPWSADEREAILRYCESDVVALERLLPVMLPHLDLPRALLRGRFMKAAARIEWNGVPINTAALALLRQYWGDIQDDLITAVDKDYGVFDGRTFRLERWERWLSAHGVPWPRLEGGRLDLSDDTFRQMARSHPAISPMRELRSALSEMRLSDLAVGSDGRNRTLLSAFRSRTGRCQPSNTRYIFGPSVWLRNLIKPPPGYGVAYVDWCQQEHGIAAVLSGDIAMQAAYTSGDPYLAFAKQAGAVPSDATKHTHGSQRELFKQCALAVAYGMEAEGLACRIGQPAIVGRDLLRSHRETYRRFGAGRTPRSITPCSPARSRRRSAGRCTWGRISIRGRCEISRARRMAPKCCGSLLASPPRRALRSARWSMTPCWFAHHSIGSTLTWSACVRVWPKPHASCSTASSCGPTYTLSGIPTTTPTPAGR